MKSKDVVKNDVVKKTEYNKLAAKVDNIDTTNFVSRTKYEKDGSDFEDKINKVEKKVPDVIDFVKKQISILKFLKYKVKYLVLLV